MQRRDYSNSRVIPAAPSPLRRFDHYKGERRVNLAADHPAVIEGRTLFPNRRTPSAQAKNLLIGGHNSRKTGKRVEKGKWAGFPIYTLTLEERATCPETCNHWRTCYGNGSHWAQRIEADEDFESRLWSELEALNKKHRRGFVVRLHILGDFYSVGYVNMWARALDAFPALRVFGYTARGHDDPIGRKLVDLAVDRWDRFAMRFSGWAGELRGAVTVEKGEATPYTICPAQTGKTECCGTCALCWQSERTIAFERH